MKHIGKAASQKSFLFVCRENIGRSQIAKAFFEDIYGIRAQSAGIDLSNPALRVGDVPEAKNIILAMREMGLNIAENTRQKLNTELFNRFDYVVVLAELSVVPVWLTESPRVLLMPVEDLKYADMDLTRKIIDLIKQKVKELEIFL